jgi:PAS domain S-box-containing protein
MVLILKTAPRVLLVEPDIEMQRKITQMLASHYATGVATDAASAFILHTETTADLVLANIMTDSRAGADVNEIRRNTHFNAVPIIVYSSPGTEDVCLELMDIGINDYLVTPFTEHQLLARVRAQLRASQTCAESFRAIRDSEERYRTFANAMHTSSWRATPDGDIVGDALGWEKITGQSGDEYRGSGWTAAVHPDDLERVVENWKQVLRDRTPLDIDFKVRQRDGGYRYVRSQGTPITSADGTVREWTGAVVDIDERKRAEQALRTSEEEFRANFELAGIGQAQVDPGTGRFLRVNPRFCEMLGYSADELLNLTFFDITYPGDLEQNSASWLDFTRGGSTHYRVEKRYVRKDGSIIWGEITATMLRDADGQPLRTVSMIQDITERRLSEAVFQSQKSALEMVAQGASLDDVLQFVVASLKQQAHESLVVSILLLDRDGQHVSLGAASGLPENLRQKLRDGVAVRDLSGPCRLVFTQKQPTFVPDVNADPNWKDFRDMVAHYGLRAAWSTPIMASDQRLLGSFCVYYRRTRAPGTFERSMIEAISHTVAIVIERKQAEAEREEMLIREQVAREQAESANRVKDEFLAVVSHELRTPLTAITGWANMLLDGKVPESAQLRALQAIQRQSRSQRQLIDDLLDVSRIVSGKLRLDFGDVEPSKIVGGAVDVVRPTAEAKNIDLVVHMDTREGTISGDPERLQQVIWNLLSNAIKFTPEGGRVEIRSRWFDSRIEIVVTDTGQGISPEFLPYVFERFRQADVSTTRAHGGLGLGLAIVRHLVEIHGGTVQADSAGKDKGSSFTVQLPGNPRRSTAAATSEPELQKQISGAATGMLSGLRILIVDDDSDSREVIAAELSLYGANTSVCDSADNAVRKLETFKPDVIVADIGMPGEDGYTMIRKIRNSPDEKTRLIPAIALTAYAGDGNRQRALDAGYQKHISKPAEPEELVLAVAGVTRIPHGRHSPP